MLMKSARAWAIVDETTGELVGLYGHEHVPIYWARDMAYEVASERGFKVTGRNREVRICRVEIQEDSSAQSEECRQAGGPVPR